MSRSNDSTVDSSERRVTVPEPSAVCNASLVRVLICSGDPDAQWGTVGVSANIVEASWRALVDSVEYKLARDAGSRQFSANKTTALRRDRANPRVKLPVHR